MMMILLDVQLAEYKDSIQYIFFKEKDTISSLTLINNLELIGSNLEG